MKSKTESTSLFFFIGTLSILLVTSFNVVKDLPMCPMSLDRDWNPVEILQFMEIGPGWWRCTKMAYMFATQL